MSTKADFRAPLPVCKAILLCDQVVEDDAGKLNLIGTFNNFYVDKSLTSPSAEAYCQVTDALGHYRFHVEVHDLYANEVIARSPATEIAIDDPLMTTSVIIRLPPLRLTHQELHDLVVFANGEEVDRRSFGVAAAEGSEHVRTE